MDRNAVWKWLVLAVLTAASLALVWPPSRKVRLGLDLMGGTSFTLQINVEELRKSLRETGELEESAVEAKLPEETRRAQEQTVMVVRSRVDKLGVAEPVIYPEKSDRVVVQIPGLKDEDYDRAVKMIKSAAFLEFALVDENNDKLVSELFQKGLAPEGYLPAQVPGRRGHNYYYRRDPKVSPTNFTDEYQARLQSFHAPRDCRFMLMERVEDGQKLYVPYYVKKNYELRGDSLAFARVDRGQVGQPHVAIGFDSKGARRFERITDDYRPGGYKNKSLDGRRYLAIILDGKLYSAPWIKETIYGGEARITGEFSEKEAQDLRIVLSSGSLPAPVDIIETRRVDPTLGRDSIRSGATAAVIGSVAVAVFMLGYYLLCGVIADLALAFNLLLLPLGMMLAQGFLGMFSGAGLHMSDIAGLPVLTLPGIAGIALTMGMAVDANVLIYERIREELKAGKRIATAVEAGYDRAFLTIVDSNVTTVFAAVLLFMLGSGPIRGFGVTLTAGILVSMYTAIVLTRMIFNMIVRFGKMQTLRMLSFFKETNIDFLGKRKMAMLISAAVIAGTWAWMVWSGIRDPSSVLGIDFTGGSVLTFTFDKKEPAENIRSVLAGAVAGDTSVQYQRDPGTGAERLQVRTRFGAGDAARQAITGRFAGSGYKCVAEDDVGPQVGGELVRKALWALGWSCVGMIVYISIRFEFAFAVGAIVALIHDMLACLGIYCLLGRQVNTPTIAAVLAIVGYSINDTIVIFDRIRENARLIRNKSFVDVCNLSVNASLNRTVLTSLTTLITVGILLVLGGGAIFDFALLLFVGIIVGTYSSVFIATPVMLALRREKKPEKA